MRRPVGPVRIAHLEEQLRRQAGQRSNRRVGELLAAGAVDPDGIIVELAAVGNFLL